MYNSLEDMWITEIRHLLARGNPVGSRDGGTVEELGYHAGLARPLDNVIFNKIRKFSLPYACAETLWYLSCIDSTEAILPYAPQYKRFVPDGHAFGAYGYRWMNNPGFESHCSSHRNQLFAVIAFLKQNPSTRQAIMTMWDSGDLVESMSGKRTDIPCTLSLQFLVRNDRLNLVTTMRSNDVWLGLPYDVFAFTTIQRIVATELGYAVGYYYHQSGSEHLYNRNEEKANSAIQCHHNDYHTTLVTRSKWKTSLAEDITCAINAEKIIRLNSMVLLSAASAIERPVLRDLVFGTALKWTNFEVNNFDNSLFREHELDRQMRQWQEQE